MWPLDGIVGFDLLDGCLDDWDWDWDRSRLVGCLNCWEDDGEGRREAGCELGLMKGGADGCMCAYTADVFCCLGAGEAVRGGWLKYSSLGLASC